MSAPTMNPKELVWPPFNGNPRLADAPTQVINVPGLRTEAFAADPPADTDFALGGLSLGAILADEIRKSGGPASAQDEGVSMTLSLQGESNEPATRHAATRVSFGANRDALPHSDIDRLLKDIGRIKETPAAAPVRHTAQAETAAVRSHRHPSRLGNFSFRSARLLLGRLIHGRAGKHTAAERKRAIL